MEYFAVFMLGLLSTPHCLGMCGGIASALLYGSSRKSVDNSATQTLAFNAATGTFGNSGSSAHLSSGSTALFSHALLFGSGKMLAYGLLGGLAGSIGVGAVLAAGPAAELVVGTMRAVAALLLIALGLYTAGWWLGLQRLEKMAFRFWQPIMRQLDTTPWHSVPGKLGIGMVWGLLPCGLVYSMLGLALVSGSTGSGVLLMLSFGLGTLPFVLGLAGAAHTVLPLLNNPAFKRMAGVLLLGFGLYSLTVALDALVQGLDFMRYDSGRTHH